MNKAAESFSVLDQIGFANSDIQSTIRLKQKCHASANKEKKSFLSLFFSNCI